MPPSFFKSSQTLRIRQYFISGPTSTYTYCIIVHSLPIDSPKEKKTPEPTPVLPMYTYTSTNQIAIMPGVYRLPSHMHHLLSNVARKAQEQCLGGELKRPDSNLLYTPFARRIVFGDIAREGIVHLHSAVTNPLSRRQLKRTEPTSLETSSINPES